VAAPQDDFAVTALSPRRLPRAAAAADVGGGGDGSELQRASTAPLGGGGGGGLAASTAAARRHGPDGGLSELDDRPLKKTSSGLKALKDELR
jgi:hypothetical protein